MVPFAEGLLWLLCCPGIGIAPAAEAAAPALRTFVVDKPAPAAENEPSELLRSMRGAAIAPPPNQGRLHAVVGIGYVQHADWGTEALVSGAIGRLNLQADSLFTFGPQGPLLDRGTIALHHSDQHWLFEAGDLFSNLRGPATGARVSWQITERWRPSVALYGAPRHATFTNTVLAYRDRVELGRVTIDGEIATDASHFLRGRVAVGQRFAIEASYRRTRLPEAARDSGVQAEVRLWRGLMATGGLFESDRLGQQSTWQTVGVRIPVHRSIGLTFERTLTTTGISRSTSSAVMVDAHSRQLLFLQRYEWGDTHARQGGLLSVQRDQLQSMASYTMGPRVNVGLRVATQWQETGPSQNWLEAQTTVRVTRHTLLQVTAPVPQVIDTDRLRVVVEQGLPRRFSVLAEYGRPSAYQDIQYGAEPPRFRLMLRRSFDVATPAGGGTVEGRVLDYVGRPVAGARVSLGPYSTDTNVDGQYVFAHVPPGDFELTLDTDFLPADYAWDGRSRRVMVKPSTRVANDLVVAPLNAIHGRVYADRDGNGRFDRGEGVLGAVIRMGDRVTASDADGAYDFYNIRPGTHTVQLDADKLPAGFDAGGRTTLTVELREDRPATGVDFVVVVKTKPVIWRTIK